MNSLVPNRQLYTSACICQSKQASFYLLTRICVNPVVQSDAETVASLRLYSLQKHMYFSISFEVLGNIVSIVAVVCLQTILLSLLTDQIPRQVYDSLTKSQYARDVIRRYRICFSIAPYRLLLLQ